MFAKFGTTIDNLEDITQNMNFQLLTKKRRQSGKTGTYVHTGSAGATPELPLCPSPHHAMDRGSWQATVHGVSESQT